ncbi:MAG TPA: hypothetical protein DEO65_11480 [Bacillus bacterium]|nr:hypothetical protein [Siminovitchia fordii]HBZ10487.1 hypothetical protein [Bacillus sp. (in: firmicutes)]
MLRILFLTIISLYLISTLFPALPTGNFISFLCFFIVCITFPQVKTFVKLLGGIFLILGAGLLWYDGAEWQQYILSFGPMLDLITMFVILPILAIPIKLGNYGNDIQYLIQKNIKSAKQLYKMTSGISYFFSIFMNLATLPMTYYPIRPALESFHVQNKERFMSNSITRGFAMPLIWAPVTPIVGVVIVLTGVSWVSILPLLIPLSIFGLLLDWVMEGRKMKSIPDLNLSVSTKSPVAAATEEPGHGRPGRVLHILTAILVFNIFISMAEARFPYSFLILVSILVVPFSLIWSSMLNKGKEFMSSLREHINIFPDRMKEQFFIYLSAGFLISSIKISGANETLNHIIVNLISVISAEFFIILLPLFPLAFAFVGLHPAVTLSLMAGALDPAVIGISPIVLAVAMLSGAISAFLIGPYNATLGLMASIIKESSLKVSNWNLKFTIIFICWIMLYLFVLQLIIHS